MQSYSALSLKQDLSQLQEILGSLEGYPQNENIGFRSLKNLGIWLLLYALMEKKDQEAIIKTMLPSDKITEATQLIQKLSNAASIKQILEDYETASGQFIIKMPLALKNALMKNAKALGLEDILMKHAEDHENFSFEMKNTIAFQWASKTIADFKDFKHIQYKHVAKPLTASTQDFEGAGNVPFLTARESVCYSIVESNKQFYHIAKLPSLQQQGNDEKSTQETYTYLIQALDEKHQPEVQHQYFQIISQIPHEDAQREHLAGLYEKHRKKAIPGLQIEEEMSASDKKSSAKQGQRVCNLYSSVVHFPALAETLKTIEERRGIYAVFSNRLVGTYQIQEIHYHSEHALNHDSEGGSIKNRESIKGPIQELSMRKDNRVILSHVFNEPFVLVHETPQATDYYPFQIASPNKDLQKHYGPNDRFTTFRPKASEKTSVMKTISEGFKKLLH